MKKFYTLFTLLLAFTFLFVSAAPVQAQETQYPAELQYYDAQVDLLLPRLDAFQADYYTVNGRYYQALDAFASAPDVPSLPDRIDASPTDQIETLAYFWQYADLPDVLAWSFSVSVYSGPDGDGYVLNVETAVNGQVWRRSVNHGPEDWRASDWYLVEE